MLDRLAACPELSVEITGEAVKSRLFPLYEVSYGDEWKLSPMPDKAGVETYSKHQDRFTKNVSQRPSALAKTGG